MKEIGTGLVLFMTLVVGGAIGAFLGYNKGYDDCRHDRGSFRLDINGKKFIDVKP
jgi:hypothetical protein